MSSFIDDLLNATPIGKKEAVRAKLRVAVSEALLLALESTKASKADLAGRIGVSRSAVTQALCGHRNMSLNKLADMADALELEALVSLSPKSETEFKRLLRGVGKEVGLPATYHKGAGGSSAANYRSIRGVANDMTSVTSYIALSKDAHGSHS